MSWISRFLGDEPEDPGSAPVGDPLLVAEVEAVIAELRPMFHADGGDVQLVSVDDDGWVHVRFRGACHHCAAADSTLHGALEPRLRERLDWVTGVRAV